MMIDEPEAKKRIFQRVSRAISLVPPPLFSCRKHRTDAACVAQGLAHDVRKDVWPFLLEVYPWDSTTEERKSAHEDKT